MITPKQHKQRHIKLHEALDELIADWSGQTKGLLKETSVMTLLEWSFGQMCDPTDKYNEHQI